jgi:hypothetical protein
MKTKMHYKMSLVGVFLLASCLLSAPALRAYTGTLTDDFNGPSLNTGLWTVNSAGGPSVAQTSDQLQVNMSFSTYPMSGFVGGVKSNFILVGDFDMQVDFSLLIWPYKDGIHVQLAAYLDPVIADVERLGAAASNAETFVTNLLGHVSIVHPGVPYPGDTALSGTMRLVRTGNQVTGFYMDPATSGQWVTIGTYTDPDLAIDMPIYLSAFGGPGAINFGGVDALVAFDNFQVQYTGVENLVPIPPTCLLLGSGLLCLGFPGLRRRMKKS